MNDEGSSGSSVLVDFEEAVVFTEGRLVTPSVNVDALQQPPNNVAAGSPALSTRQEAAAFTHLSCVCVCVSSAQFYQDNSTICIIDYTPSL